MRTHPEAFPPHRKRRHLNLGACLFLVHGGKVRRVIMADELLRVLRIEIPEIGTRPNSQAQKLWDRVVVHGKAGAAAKARKKAERARSSR